MLATLSVCLSVCLCVPVHVWLGAALHENLSSQSSNHKHLLRRLSTCSESPCNIIRCDYDVQASTWMPSPPRRSVWFWPRGESMGGMATATPWRLLSKNRDARSIKSTFYQSQNAQISPFWAKKSKGFLAQLLSRPLPGGKGRGTPLSTPNPSRRASAPRSSRLRR